MKTTLTILLLLLLSACCKNETEPDPCSTETRVRFFNGTDLSFDKIRFGVQIIETDFNANQLTSYIALDKQQDINTPNMSLSKLGNYKCFASIDLQYFINNNGCYTIYISEVDTLHVFNDTTLWYKVIKN